MVGTIETGANFEIQPERKTHEVNLLTMIWVSPGDFIMGKNHAEINLKNSSENDSLLVVYETPTKISKGFWLSQYLISYNQWQIFGKLKSKYWEYLQQYEKEKDYKIGNGYPIGATWLDAMRFCRELNIRYKSVIPKGYHFSLPTELQWEYSAKAGKEKDDYMLSVEDYIEIFDLKKLKKVSSAKNKNEWGFCDMVGNIRELCYDIPADYPGYYQTYCDDIVYPTEGVKVVDWVGNKDPENFYQLPDIQKYRILRGGCSSTYRSMQNLNISHVGFRISLRPIIDWEYCDLDDPWLKEEGINILGD